MGRKRQKTFKREKDQKPSRAELIARRVAETLANTSDRQPLRDPSTRESDGDAEMDSVESGSEELADAAAWDEIPGVPATDADGVEAASPQFAPTVGDSATAGFRSAPEQAAIQRALKGADTTQDDVPDQVLDVIGQGGQPLDSDLRRRFEQRMDADFSDVRVHTGPAAATAAEAIDAKAFTCGNDIVFNSGEYDPDSPSGKHLLAHELAHVTQQTEGAISMLPGEDAEVEIDPDDSLEREADRVAEMAFQPDAASTGPVSTEVHDIYVQRAPKGADLGDISDDKSLEERLRSGEFTDFEKPELKEYFGIDDEVADDLIGVIADLDKVHGIQETSEGLTVTGDKGSTEVVVIYPENGPGFYTDNSDWNTSDFKSADNDEIGGIVEGQIVPAQLEKQTDRTVVHPSQAMRADEGANMATVSGPDLVTEDDGELYLGEVKFTEKKPSKGHMGNGREIESGNFDILEKISELEKSIRGDEDEQLSMQEMERIRGEVETEIGTPNEPEELKNAIDLIAKRVSESLKGIENIDSFDRTQIEQSKKQSVKKGKARQGSREWFKDGMLDGLLSSDAVVENFDTETEEELRAAVQFDEFKTEAIFVHDKPIGETITGGPQGLATDDETDFDRVIIYRTCEVTK